MYVDESNASTRPEASSCTTSILPRPITLPSALVAGGVAEARRMSANDASPPARNSRRPISRDIVSSPLNTWLRILKHDPEEWEPVSERCVHGQGRLGRSRFSVASALCWLE